MKQIQLLLLVVLFTAGTCLSPAWGDQFAKEKKISKHYTISASDKLSIENTYGEVTINTWDKNEITVDINIKVKTNSESKTQDLLDDIEIEESRKSNAIIFRTNVDKSTNVGTTIINHGHFSKMVNTEISIDYTVNMPRRNNLDLTNKFGNVSIDDFEGNLSLALEYGKLKTQKLSGTENDIKVKFGSVDITSIENGKLDISYSKLTIDKAQKIDVKSSFEKTIINSVKQLKINQRYGNLNIGSVETLSGSVEFAGMDIDKLSKSADMELKYVSKAVFSSIGADVDIFDVNASFGSISCKFENGVSLSGSINTSFGHFQNDAENSNIIFEKRETTRYSNQEYYSGKIGHGAGKLKLNINYGDIVFR